MAHRDVEACKLGLADSHFFGSFIRRWQNDVRHCAVQPNIRIRLEDIGFRLYPMPVPIEGAYNDGELRCDFTSVDANVLRACTWFKDLVIVEHVPALKAEKIALLADRKDTLTTEKKALDDEQRKLKKEVEDTDQRVAGNKQLLGVEKNTTLEAVIKAEKEKEKLYDTRESLQNQNAATIRALSPLPMRTRVYCSGRHCYCFMLHPIELFSDKGC